MKTNLFYTITLAFLFTSCYTTRITPEFLNPETRNQDFLSKFELEFDEQSFSSVFAYTQNIVDEGIVEGDVEFQRNVQIVNESPTSVDIKNIVKKYYSNHSINSIKTLGYIVFGVSFYDYRSVNILREFSIVTFGLLNLAGMPNGKFIQTVELTASVYNSSGNLIKTYSGFGKDKYLTGVYYHSQNQKRPSLIKSIKSAIEDIDNQIHEEQAAITQVIAN